MPAPSRASSAEPQAGQARGDGSRVAAVVAAQRAVAVQDERDVAVRAADRRAAGAAVQRRRDAAPVEQQDRLAAALGDPPQLGEQRRRERIAGLAAEVDDPHRRQLAGEPRRRARAARALAQLSGRGVADAEDGDRALERGALGGDVRAS